MYADFDYYTAEYGGKVIGSADDFNHYARKAKRRIDTITTNKLQFAFPTEDNAVMAVKDCFCELTDFLCQLDRYQTSAMDSVGTVAQADGTVKGKVITSVSSGSESISYSASGSADSSIAEAAKDKKTADAMIYGIVKDGLAYIADANGVNLLYAGPYPARKGTYADN